MPSIIGFHIPPLSCFILYFQGCLAVVFCLWKPICAFWYGKRLEGDRTLLGLFYTYIYNTSAASSMFFKAAWDNNLRQKRMLAGTQIFAAIICWICSFFPSSKDMTPEKVERDNFILMRIIWFLLFFSFVTIAVIELEQWRERERLKLDEERVVYPHQSEKANLDQSGGVGKIWLRRGAISGRSGIPGLGSIPSEKEGVDMKLRNKDYGLQARDSGGVLEYYVLEDQAQENDEEGRILDAQGDSGKQKIE